MDIQDYLQWGFIGEDQIPATSPDLNWSGAFTVFLETKAAHLKAVKEYYRISVVLSSLDRRHNIIDRYSEWSKAKLKLEDSSIIFWSSMICLSQQGKGYNEGDYVTEISGHVIYYTTYTEEIYNTYISDLKNLMLALKNLMKVCSSGENFENNYTIPVHKIYDFSSFSGDFSNQINNYQLFNNVNDWDGTFRIVTEGTISVGSHVYYLNTSGYRNKLRGGWDGSGLLSIFDLSDNSLVINSSGIVVSVDSGFTFDSISNYTAPVI